MIPLEILAGKLPDPNISEAQRLAALAEVEQYIKNYCNITKVPQELYFVWANMAADLLRYNPDAETSGKVSSISEGDTSVSFAKEDAIRVYLNQLQLDYRQQLQSFRKVRW